MDTIRTVADLRDWIQGERIYGRTIGLVPTMGALHAGHMQLVKAARQKSDRVITSIFVNPAQFGPGEDFEAYPRGEAEDAAKLRAAGSDVLFAPSRSEMYPGGFAANVTVAGLDGVLCGASRPGHFDGVATVVTKLFNQVRPNFAFFGEKDWQQLAIIRRVAADLDQNTEIIGVPTVREDDGLAMSSRNRYLSAAERAAASTLPRALQKAAADIADGKAVADALAAARGSLTEAGFTVQYLELRHEETLETLAQPEEGARLFVATKIGMTRLIDNLPVSAA
ncbi:MAG: pantoate--beta-alanine ligase [Pacificimonas sp.]|nr:pantoate--beta-alanine ligase [Pacificimonas sp.]